MDLERGFVSGRVIIQSLNMVADRAMLQGQRQTLNTAGSRDVEK